MNDTTMTAPWSWSKRLGVGVAALIATFIVALIIFQKLSDGPYGPLQGGPFSSGELVDATSADYPAMEGKPTELLLVGPGTSRTLGYFMRDGKIYISCDLGFMWNRFEGTRKLILNIIYIFKSWHLDAVEDGRAELRIEGKRYSGYLHLVKDPALNSALKTQLEDLARKWIAPQTLGPAPEAPNDIVFFEFKPNV